jgi:hypothetical protein
VHDWIQLRPVTYGRRRRLTRITRELSEENCTVSNRIHRIASVSIHLKRWRSVFLAARLTLCGAALYRARVLVILVVLALAVFGIIHLTRTLEPRQRLITWLIFVLAIVFVFWKLTQMGVLGRAAGGE